MAINLPLRHAVPEELTWDLTQIFATAEAWEQEFAAIAAAARELAQYSGEITRDVTQTITIFEKILAVNEALERVYVYASHAYDQDTTNQVLNSYYTRAGKLWTEVNAAEAFFEPEVLALPADAMERLQSQPEAQPYQHYFETLRAKQEHTLPAEQEALLASAGDVFSSSQTIFGALDNADMTFGSLIDDDGNDVTLSNGLYNQLMQSQNRRVRRDAFETLYDSYMSLQNTFAATLSAKVNTHNFLAQAHHYTTARQAAITKNDLPETLFTTLVDAVNDNLSSLHRLTALRKQLLGVDSLHSYDMRVPLVSDVQFDISYEEAQEIVLEALAPLGEAYQAIVREAFTSRWIDVCENKGKRSGAYSGGAYGTPSYILLNWSNTFDDMFTLAHEIGHSVHSYLSNHNQDYHNSGYPIFLAEIASTTNEALLTDYLLKRFTDDQHQAYLLNHYLDSFSATVFRQTQFAEFEDWMHEQAQAGVALTAEVLSTAYADINSRYYGPARTDDQEIAYEWARIPHFYYNYYVYQYATGEAAATSLADKILNHEQAPAYCSYLKAGCSDYPLAIMQQAGIDMQSRDYLDSAFAVFNDRLAQFERLMAGMAGSQQ